MYETGRDWLRQRTEHGLTTLSWLFNFCFKFDKLDPKLNIPSYADKCNVNKLSVSSSEIWLTETFVNNTSVRTVHKLKQQILLDSDKASSKINKFSA